MMNFWAVVMNRLRIRVGVAGTCPVLHFRNSHFGFFGLEIAGET